jgi:hypothetical protein
LGGVPTGVASPPTEAPNDVISIMPKAKRRAARDRGGAGSLVGGAAGSAAVGGADTPAVGGPCRSPAPVTWAAIASPIGYIIAVVATLLIQAERKVVTAP